MTVAWMIQDDYQGLAPALAELRRVAERLGHPYFIAWYHTTVGWAGMHQGDLATAERALETSLDYDREIGGASTAGIAMALLGEIESLTGRYDAAEARLGPFFGRAAALLGTHAAQPLTQQVQQSSGCLPPGDARPRRHAGSVQHPQTPVFPRQHASILHRQALDRGSPAA